MLPLFLFSISGTCFHHDFSLHPGACSLALKGHQTRTYRIVPASRTVGGILEISLSPSSSNLQSHPLFHLTPPKSHVLLRKLTTPPKIPQPLIQPFSLPYPKLPPYPETSEEIYHDARERFRTIGWECIYCEFG